MSGHSKWSQIKHKKALTDKKKGQIFSKMGRLLTLAARNGVDPKFNPQLAQTIEKAKSVNMPNENIERAIKKVSDKNQSQLEELSIDVLGPGGVAFRIRAVTDNRNRTLAEIKTILGEHGAKMVQPGSIQWMFGQPPVTMLDDPISGQVEKLLEALDDQDEVEDVLTNLE